LKKCVGDEKVGEIDHLIIDKLSGGVIDAVMGFGGFLGLGHSHYPVPWGCFEIRYIARRVPHRMRQSSAMTRGRTEIGRPSPIAIMGLSVIEKHRRPDK
jgi:hypothetical protein